LITCSTKSNPSLTRPLRTLSTQLQTFLKTLTLAMRMMTSLSTKQF